MCWGLLLLLLLLLFWDKRAHSLNKSVSEYVWLVGP